MIPNNKLIPISKKLMGDIYPYQEVMFNNDANELIINKSRQVGISYSVACWALLQATINKRTELIISPSLRQSKHMMDYIHVFLDKFRDKFECNLREETKTSLIFEDAGQIHSLPNSANTVRGFAADDIYIDEFAHFTCGTDKDIIEAITPSISRGGRIVYISTPFGDQNLFYKYWNRTGIARQLINWQDCPAFNKENISSIKETIGLDAFEQEYNNAFLSDMEGQEFPTELIHSCIDHELQYTNLESTVEYIGGADIGRTNDLTAIVSLSKENETYTLRNKEVMRQTAYNKQLDYFNYILNNHKYGSFTIDESGIGNMLAEEISRNHRINRITFNNENKQEMVGNLKKIMQDGKLRIPNDPQLIDSIRGIRRIYTPSNYLKFDSDRSSELGHNDLFWALALALYMDNSYTYLRMG